MKVLISAYACEPNVGSEPEVGLRAVLASAEEHDTWVLLRHQHLPKVERVVVQSPHAGRIHLVGVSASDPSFEPEDHGKGVVHLDYHRWQRKAAKVAVALDREIDFDLVHHATFATYWTVAGVADVPKPLVWGPVGGGVNPPLRLLGELGLKGLLEALVRVQVRQVLGRAVLGGLSGRDGIALAQNRETAERIHSAGFSDVRVVPNATAVAGTLDMPQGVERRTPTVVCVGRLLPWKGGKLALRTFRQLGVPGTVLLFLGRGSDQARLDELSQRWGVSDVVSFRSVPREELLQTVASAGVLLHTSLHEESSLAVAEALSLGTPVVCLDHGGPAELTRHWPGSPSSTIVPTTPEKTARDLAEAVRFFLDAPPPIPERASLPAIPFSASLLAAYRDVVNRRVGWSEDQAERLPSPSIGRWQIEE